LARPGRGDELDRRTRAPHGRGQLRIRLAQAGGAAQRHDQHVDHRLDILPRMDLTVLPEPLAICRLPPTARIPSWALEEHESLVSITRTAEELSIVCPEEAVPPDVERVEDGWRALKVPGPIPFETTGVMAAIAQPLAAA